MSNTETPGNPSWLIIVNPASADGRTGRDWPRNSDVFRSHLPPFNAVFTEAPGQAVALARRGAEEGYRVLAVHGGDGTFNEVVNGLLAASRPDVPALALLPSGTGADLVRSLGIVHDARRAARQAVGGRVRMIDVGWANFLGLSGHPEQRYFINVTDIGFGGDLVRYVNGHSKRLGGRVSFFRGLLATLVHYPNKRIRVTLDEEMPFEVKASSIVIANGQYFGGGMWVAPEAHPDDGKLEVVIIGDVTRVEVLTNIPRLYRGTLAGHPKVKTFRAHSLHLDSDEEVFIDMDGELVGRLPVRLVVSPGRIGILGGAESSGSISIEIPPRVDKAGFKSYSF